MAGSGTWRRLVRPWAKRALLLAVGLALVAVAAYVVLHAAPGENVAPAEGPAMITERARTWTPEDGREEVLRQRTLSTQDDGNGWVLKETVDTAPSPRGTRFQLPLDEDLEVASEPGARVSFPPTPLFEAPPERVYLAVPWADEGADPVGAIDTFRRMGTVELQEVTFVRYHARHSAQFFIHEGTIWFRATDRTALVEPVTGTIVDYHEAETLWTKPFRTHPLLGNLQNELATREKVWEATVEPTPASKAQLVDRALAERAEHLRGLVTKALAALSVGEMALFAAISGRPRRLVDGRV